MNGFPMSPPCLLVCLMINNQHTTVKDNYLKRAIHARTVENFPIYERIALFESLIQAC